MLRHTLCGKIVANTALGLSAWFTASAWAIPVCTDGYGGGPPQALCGGRIFPEAHLAQNYIQHVANPVTGFQEYRHGVEFLAQQYPRWISVFTLRDYYGSDLAVSAGDDGLRADEAGDSGDGRDVLVIKLTDHEVPDAGKHTLFFSLSVHGNERGGLEGGLRAAEDLAIAATEGGTIADGVDNYESTTGRAPVFKEYPVAQVLAQEVVYLVDFNLDGWAQGDLLAVPPALYARGNSRGTDLNRQMPTIGRINNSRNPLEEQEMFWGTEFMQEVAAAGKDGLMTYGADVHGESTSNAFIDIMYPGGQFDSVDHRRLMAIAERTKSVIDRDIVGGIADLVEQYTGGNDSENPPVIPTKPAHWATVWDTLGYTDTGFIGDYMATDLAVTGMDYEIFLNNVFPDKVWTVALQQAHIDGTRAIIKTAMAYALTQDQEFNADNVVVDPIGRAAYVFDPDPVTDADGVGRLAGPNGDGIGANGEPVAQRSYSSTRMRWFTDTDPLMPQPFMRLLPGDIALDPATLDAVDTLVLADDPLPRDAQGRTVDPDAYYAAVASWVARGGNLVLTDRAIHALVELGVVANADSISDIEVYLPYTDIQDFAHPMVEGLRPNARQLVESTLLGYGINSDELAARMTVVDEAAWSAAGGAVVGTTGSGLVSVGQVPVGQGQVRILGGALPTATEANDHRYGLRDYAMSYTALFIMENAIQHDAPGLGNSVAPPRTAPTTNGSRGGALGGLLLLGLVLGGLGYRRRSSRRARLPAA